MLIARVADGAFRVLHRLPPVPGDPVLALAGEDRDPETLAAIRDRLGLNDPLPVQYARWLGNALTGDLGRSYRTGEPVLDVIAQKLPVTLQLGIMAMAIALIIGIPAGILSATRRGTFVDYGANVLALSGLSLPNFWLGIMLIMLVSVRWRLLPASGYVPFFEDPVQSLRTMIMPAFVLGTALAATLMRHTRSAMLWACWAPIMCAPRAPRAWRNAGSCCATPFAMP